MTLLVTRLHGVRVVVGPVPAHLAPGLIQGELRDDLDRPVRPWHEDSMGRVVAGQDSLRTAADTAEGLGRLLTALDEVARNETLRAVGRAS